MTSVISAAFELASSTKGDDTVFVIRVRHDQEDWQSEEDSRKSDEDDRR